MLLNKVISYFSWGLMFIMALALAACEPDEELIDEPETDPREAFIGTWSCTETPLTQKRATYLVEIINNPENSAEVLIRNFGLLGEQVKARALVIGNSIAIERQATSNGWEIEGEGEMQSSSTINWEYELFDGHTIYQLKAVYALQ